jgi:hypothetical protein
MDAPDLMAPPAQAPGSEKPPPGKKGQLNGGQSQIPRGRGAKSVPRPVLGAAPSAALRDRLVGELEDIASADDAALWAHQILSDKNSLTDADARQVEDAFQARLTALGRAVDLGNAALSPASPALQPTSSVERRTPEPAGRTPPAGGVDKSQLVHPEPRRFRDKGHVKFVAKQPCLVCGRRPSDAHHLRYAQHRALGRKVSDEFTVPLCRGHHREVHRCGDEAAWWAKIKISYRPRLVANKLEFSLVALERTRPSSVTRSGADGWVRSAKPQSWIVVRVKCPYRGYSGLALQWPEAIISLNPAGLEIRLHNVDA